jgi:hypothetical protein
MGASFTNCQVRSSDANAVATVLAPLLKLRAYISPASGGWVTVYDEATESQDSKLLIKLAKELSKALKTEVFGFLVHDSGIAVYYLCQNGELVDEFNSCPDYFGNEVSAAEGECARGVTEKLLPLAVAGTTREQIDAIIHPASEEDFPLMAEDIIRDLGILLGMDENRTGLGFEYFENEGEHLLNDAADFVVVEKGVPPSRMKSSVAAVPKPRPSQKRVTKAEAISQMKLDMLAMAVAILARAWTSQTNDQATALAKILPPDQVRAALVKITSTSENMARESVKLSKLPDRPTFEELKAARDAGPDALAALLTKRTPSILGSVAAQAIGDRMETFVAALLKHGLDPHATDHFGHKILDAAERLGTDSPIYQMIKAAAGR